MTSTDFSSLSTPQVKVVEEAKRERTRMVVGSTPAIVVVVPIEPIIT